MPYSVALRLVGLLGGVVLVPHGAAVSKALGLVKLKATALDLEPDPSCQEWFRFSPLPVNELTPSATRRLFKLSLPWRPGVVVIVEASDKPYTCIRPLIRHWTGPSWAGRLSSLRTVACAHCKPPAGLQFCARRFPTACARLKPAQRASCAIF